MKKIFSILCVFALIATATVANATPDVIDTSPIVCVDNYTPAADVVVDVPTAPVFVFCTAQNSESFVTNVESPVPLEPDLGCTDNYNIESNATLNADGLPALEPDLLTETNCTATTLTPDNLPLEPDLLTEINCTAATFLQPNINGKRPSKNKAKRKWNRKSNKSTFPGHKSARTKCAAYD